MSKLNSVQDLIYFRNSLLEKKALKKRIRICVSSECRAKGAIKIFKLLRKELKRFKLDKETELIETGCHGLCSSAPSVIIEPEGIFYEKVTPNIVPKIVSETLLKGKLVRFLLYTEPRSGRKIAFEKDIPFYKNQTRILLRNCGKINPMLISDYIANNGYTALAKALGMPPEVIIKEVKDSGLRGRGGIGFPTGLKWEFTRKSSGDEKYIICNAEEGEPYTFKDRTLLESDPHSVIEGVIIGAYAIGAKKGYIYISSEHELAIAILKNALHHSEELGLLGNNILGSGFKFELKLQEMPSAYVCGEETALIESIEGKRGMPRQRPPYPAQFGLFGRPTCVNNVETFANIPFIILHGSAEYKKLGTEKSPGSKILSISSRAENIGVAEVPLGTTLKKVLELAGFSLKELKAVLAGSASGGFISKKHFSIALEYGSLENVGAMMGAGGLLVVGKDDNIVELSKDLLKFSNKESCGKCVPCRIGLKRMTELLESEQFTDEKLELLKELSEVIKDTSMCGLGQAAPNPFLSILRNFRKEFE